MSRMVRKQVYIEPLQEKRLKQRARALDVSEAELIRRGIEQVARVPAALLIDWRAWQQELAFLRKRARLRKAQAKQRHWTRKDLHAERLQRFPH